jgi:hypothetical protein
MNRKTLLSVGSALIAVGVMSVAGYGCGDDDDAITDKDSGGGTTPETSTPETSTPDSGPPAKPPVPTLGTQIDRMGRPAVNTALNNPFNPNATTQGAAKDAYNQAADPTTWKASFIGEVAKNLAIFDGLDGVCGNQLLASQDAGSQGSALARYGTFAGVGVDDRLYLNTAGTSCNTYLAVEANAVGILINSDCGGRALKYDVIDITYSEVSIGASSGVGDDIAADPVKTASTAFPFLATPVTQ